MTDEEARRRIATDLDSTLVVEAGAGTGKTTALVGRVAGLLHVGGLQIRQVAAITFTEAAATELRERLRKELDTFGDEVDEASICTIHAFARSILTEHWLAAGIPPGFEVMSDAEERADFEERWTKFIDLLLSDREAERMLTRGISVGLRLSDVRSLAASLFDHWDRLTLDSTDRGGFGPIDPKEVMKAIEIASSYTTRCQVDDDRLLGHLETRIVPAAIGLRRAIQDEDETAVLQILANLSSLAPGNRRGRKENWDGLVEEVRDACLDAERARVDLLLAARASVLAELVPRIIDFTAKSADGRRDDGRLTFHDLLVRARDLVRDHHEVRSALRDRYQCLLIDEFQDTDPVQAELASLLTVGDTKGRLFVVGDPMQSIYRFRRADVSLYRQVADHIGDRVALDQNFRSVPGILTWVNEVFRELSKGDNPYRDLSSGRPPLSETPPVTLFGHGHDSPMGVVRARSAADTAAAVSEVVSGCWPISDDGQKVREARWKDIAVLLPTRTSLADLEEAFEMAGVPYRLEGPSLLWNCPEVRDVLSVLRSVCDPGDRVKLSAALRSPLLGCGDDDLLNWHRGGGVWDLRAGHPRSIAPDAPVARAMAFLSDLHKCQQSDEPSALVDRVLRETRSFELAVVHKRPRDHWQRLRWFLDQARSFDETTGGTLRDFLRWAELNTSGDTRSPGVGPPDPDDDAVRVLTVHGAKGLEFPVVVLAGIERTNRRSSPPVLWNEDGEMEIRMGPFETPMYGSCVEIETALDAEEAIRLLYVAVTRARDHLLVNVHHKGGKTSQATVLIEACSQVPELWRTATHKPSSPRPKESSNPPGTWMDEQRTWTSLREKLLSEMSIRPVLRPSELNARWSRGASALGPTARGVGRAVHDALRVLDLAAGNDKISGQTSSEVAHQWAAVHDVADVADVVERMVLHALSCPTVRLATTSRYWQELAVTASLDTQVVIEGVVDLAIEEDDGLVIVDYKTEQMIDSSVEHHRLQLAAYALALQISTRRPVKRAVMCFLGGDYPSEVEMADLPLAIEEVRHLALQLDIY